ncbi:mutarotase [Wenyingzhuangia sp. chi5]|uniref:Mutarotase n=1 Tax=Wenyingzhuangia gilva TaxID=3057677 RepID=A0ABT8VMV4_9FLAO|nr:mutarotase [Wenyingzhuangia sp. chi5]MDO3693311.1 mutarotase [Wenyingzhuangia sp. chi5]
MDLQEHYKKLYDESIIKIIADDYQIDTLIENPNDLRFGITLVIRPSEEVKSNIQLFLNELKSVEPHQYYYQNGDIHITVMSIISCYQGFELNTINVEEYVKIIKKSLEGFSATKIQFKGITASPSCILVQGFMENDVINNFRNRLRENFKVSSLEQSIDKRYAIQTAHSTVVRFKKKFTCKNDFLKIIEKYRNVDFGSFEVSAIELVYNDWYQREKKVKKLTVFKV